MCAETVPQTEPVVIIAGPTASGKSALAAEAAAAFGGAVVNADSMQVYRGLEVLTAAPGEAERAKAPHRLFGVLDPADVCSAGRWLGLARDAIAEVRSDGLIPFVTGGTGLYLKVLREGLSEIPEVPEELRAEVAKAYDRVGGETFLAELEAIDPAAAARLPPADRQRLVRAMSVWRATGRCLSAWQADAPQVPGVAGRYATILLDPPRAALHAAIERRFEEMLAAGALDEVRALAERVPGSRAPALRAVGVPELRAHVEGRRSLEDAVARATQATRQLAKRQATWFRHQIDADLRIEAQYSESVRDEIFSFIRRFVLTS